MSTQTIEKPAAREAARYGNYTTPAVNIRETKEAYILEAELPGVGKGGVDVTVENNELVIVGRRAVENPAGQPVHRESRKGDYRRVFDLDPAVDTSKIAAKIEQGILTLTLPKAESVKPRNIPVAG